MCDFELSRFRDLNMTAFVGTRLSGASELLCENCTKAADADAVACGMSLFRVFSDSMAEKNLSKRKAFGRSSVGSLVAHGSLEFQKYRTSYVI